MMADSKKIVILNSVDSTNNYAMAMIKRGDANSGNAVLARLQTTGKGRRGKAWKADAGDNILMSVMVQMQWLPISQQFRLSAAVALSCIDFFSKYIARNVWIKWPNDIFIGDSKAGGILIENSIQGTLWQWAVIGVGININQTDLNGFDTPATSLRNITLNEYNILELASELREAILKRIEELQTGDYGEMLEQYNQYLYAKNKKVRLKKENIVFETTIKNVSETGQLITEDAMEHQFDFDEVEWVWG